MTGDERAAEMDHWRIVTIPFTKIMDRLCALVGRSVWTHEFAFQWDELREEARTWDHAHPTSILEHSIDVFHKKAPHVQVEVAAFDSQDFPEGAEEE